MQLPATARTLRLRLGLSQRQLARRMETPRSYVSKIENGKALPMLPSLERLARALQVTVPELLRGCERSRQDEVRELMADRFIADLIPFVTRLGEIQRRAVLVQVHRLTLRVAVA
jgi:transcriptional regulator with XRE-family HTH domain